MTQVAWAEDSVSKSSIKPSIERVRGEVRPASERWSEGQQVLVHRILENRRDVGAEFIDDASFHATHAEAKYQTSPECKTKGRRVKAPEGLPSYVSQLWNVPLLTPEQEAFYFKKLHFHLCKFFQARRDAELCCASAVTASVTAANAAEYSRTRDLLVQSNMRLVVSIARRYIASTSITIDELISVGNLALIAAVDRFDFRRGFRFSTYAYTAIQRAILGLLRSEGRRRERTACPDTDPELMLEGDAGASDRAVLAASEAKQVIGKLIPSLDPRERFVVESRFGFRDGQGQSFQKIGNAIGLSKQRARTIFQAAVEKLRAEIAAPELALQKAG